MKRDIRKVFLDKADILESKKYKRTKDKLKLCKLLIDYILYEEGYKCDSQVHGLARRAMGAMVSDKEYEKIHKKIKVL